MNKRRHLPNLHDLLAFDAAAKTQNFTKAAELLNVQQPAISRRIGQLEAWFETALFRRIGSALSLTAEGEKLFAATQAGLDQIERTVLDIRGSSDKKVISVDVSISFATCWLIPRMAHFQLAHPDIDLRLVTRFSNEARHSDASDVVIYFKQDEPCPTGHRQVFSEVLIPVCAPRLMAESGGESWIERWLEHRFLFLDETGHHDDWQRLIGTDKTQLPEFIPSDGYMNFVVYLQAILAGKGIGVVWRDMVLDRLETSDLVVPFDREHRSNRGYFVFLRDGEEGNPDAKAFVDWLVKEGEQVPAP